MDVFSDNGDDFDSFFSAAKTKKPMQKSTKPSDPLEELFGIEDTAKKPYKTITTKVNTPRITKQEPTQDIDEDEDDDLGFDPKKPKAIGKSANFLDDLLAPLETATTSTAKRPKTSGDQKSILSRQSTDTTTDTSNLFQSQQPIRPKTSQGRRTSNLSNTNPDPLGLFAKEKEPERISSSGMSSPKSKRKGTTADWLGLQVEADVVEPKPQNIIRSESPKPIQKTSKPSTTKNTTEVLQIFEATDNYEDESGDDLEQQTDATAQHANESNPKNTNKAHEPIIDSTVQSIALINTLNLEANQSVKALQYQEQQLMIASQMKQQEKVLMDMQRKQETLLQHQEQQFQTLLQQQIQRHQHLEELITHQQQRISTHLQLMMSQPPPPPTQSNYITDFESSQNGNARKHESIDVTPQKDSSSLSAQQDHLQIESDNKRLELENLRLEELIANTKNNYEREIELMERSYKKQIEVLEEHLASLENRLKTEMEDMQQRFSKKIELLEEEKHNLKKDYQEELTNLKQDQEDELRKLRKNHEEDMDILKEESRHMLDAIRQTKLMEFAAVQENGSYLDCLKVASASLSNLTGDLEELKQNMKEKIDVIQLEKVKQFELKQKLLEDKERRLKINEEANEAEKNRLMELVSTLELQMSKMSRDSADDNWQLRQKLASLDAEKAVLNKEKEFFREQSQRDEERIKELKEQQLMEIQKFKLQIQDERLELQKERSKFELEKNLQTKTNIDKEKMEVDAAMQVAQDALRKADMERERLYKIQRQTEQLKRELNDREHNLNIREEELQQELLSYRMAEKVAQEAQQKSKLTEQYYQKKVQMLHQKTNEINEKEAQLSQERLLLAQDRITLHALKSKFMQEPKCALCQLSQKNQEITEAINANNMNDERMLEDQQIFSGNQMHTNGNQISEVDSAMGMNVVERLLDVNIAESFRRMNSSSNIMTGGWEALLDDDHKKLVQNNVTEDYGIMKNKNTNSYL